MGLIQAALTSVNSTLANQWKEFIYADAIPEDVLMIRGRKRYDSNHIGSNTRGDDNIISNGSTIAVADGQCMLIVDQGKVVELCAEPGECVWDASSEPSIFAGDLGDAIKNTFLAIGKRIAYGGTSGKDQRVYYINTKELMGNKYGTANPVPFRVVDMNIGLDVDISVRCFGEYSYKIVDPILFYTNVAANVADRYERSRLEGQMKTELLTALQPAFARISGMGIRYSAVMGHTTEVANALNDELSELWGKLRGIEIVSFGISSLKASEEDEAKIKELQMNAVLQNSSMKDATLAAATAQAMKDAANNPNGPAMAFMGMNMAQQAGVSAAQAYAAQPQYTAPQTVYPTAANGGYGAPAAAPAPQPAPAPAPQAEGPVQMAPAGWICPTCGQQNTGNFCGNCGTAKPEVKILAHCPNCGNALDTQNPPKFCPNCGTKLQ